MRTIVTTCTLLLSLAATSLAIPTSNDPPAPDYGKLALNWDNDPTFRNDVALLDLSLKIGKWTVSQWDVWTVILQGESMHTPERLKTAMGLISFMMYYDIYSLHLTPLILYPPAEKTPLQVLQECYGYPPGDTLLACARFDKNMNCTIDFADFGLCFHSTPSAAAQPNYDLLRDALEFGHCFGKSVGDPFNPPCGH